MILVLLYFKQLVKQQLKVVIMIYKRLNFNDFKAEFKSCGREDQFSENNLKALFEYLEELGDYELDVIELCCEYAEIALDVLQKDFYNELSEDLTEDDIEGLTITELADMLNYDIDFINIDCENDTALILS